ncbi:MAG TPA: DNA polymerase III subunit epsilon [Eggerthellaceae bacterium]|nr:DNA polymerase III subunit epsilon [Eggerthellaceae bacterium]
MARTEDYILDGTPRDVIERYESLKGLADTCSFGSLDDDVVVLDTETTGLSFNHDELIQIAAARMNGKDIVDWYVTFVDPGKFLTEDIIHLTGITDEHLIGAPSPDEALQGLVDFVGSSPVVAHNVSFDKTFVTAHPSGYPLLQNIWIDSLDLSRIALPRLRSHRLIDLVKTFDAPVSTHRADADVSATCVIYRILLAAISQMPLSLVEEIGAMESPDNWSTGLVFKQMGELMKGSSVSNFKGVSRETPADARTNVSDTASRGIFSLRDLRKGRILSLPARTARKDAAALDSVPLFPSREEVDRAFSEEGVLGLIYGDYEPRQEQRTMAQAIRDAFEASENLVVEAGTGVGKSMAYLVPSALFAQKNSVAVGVATKTNSLLDQLVYRELPALAHALGQAYPSQPPLTWAPLKGISHYPCLRKVARIVENGPEMKEVQGRYVSQAPSLAALLSYIEQSEFDDMDSLKMDYRALPRWAITTKSSECLRRKCPYFGKLCFVHGARRRAETADIIVTNHTLLFCDLEAEGGLLPTARHWVVDEAHATEDEARRSFASTVDSEEVARLAERVGTASARRNVFDRAERSLSNFEDGQVTLFLGLLAKAKAAGSAFEAAASNYTTHVKDLLYFDPLKRNRRGQSYENVDIWVNAEVRQSAVFCDIAALAKEMAETSDKLIAAAADVVGYLEGIDEAAVAQRDIASLAMELKDLRNAAELFFMASPENYAYQASLHRKKDRKVDSMKALPLDVGEIMNDTLFSSSHSVVFASATLTVGSTFESFEKAIGLNRGEESRARELALPSSYDFDNNMIVYVVKDMPEPNDPSYLAALNDLLVKVHRAQRGSMLTLFTNRREMERSFDEVMPQLKADDLRVVCQKYGVSVKGLRDDFLADEHLSLFALKSFWEGFDAPGATLKGVIIPKLPFGRPTDPLYLERAARDDRAWWRYVLPQAVIETKQAAGRLIRKADDHGVLILADKRLVTKSYGKIFLRSLQSKTVRFCTVDEIATTLSMLSGW